MSVRVGYSSRRSEEIVKTLELRLSTLVVVVVEVVVVVAAATVVVVEVVVVVVDEHIDGPAEHMSRLAGCLAGKRC